jgi:hypothetical protein
VLTAEDMERLGGELGTEQAAFMWCGAVLRLRWAEAAGLTVDRLNLLTSSITIDRQMNRSGELVTPKSEAGTRKLACPTRLTEDLAALLALRGLSAADRDALVFVNAAADHLRTRTGEVAPASLAAKRRNYLASGCTISPLPHSSLPGWT